MAQQRRPETFKAMYLYEPVVFGPKRAGADECASTPTVGIFSQRTSRSTVCVLDRLLMACGW